MMIGGLAEAGGVGVETIRYYQRRGLLRTPDPGGTTRRYEESDLRRLRFIRQAQAAGFTLNQIGELLTLDAGTDRTRARAMARYTPFIIISARSSEVQRILGLESGALYDPMVNYDRVEGKWFDWDYDGKPQAVSTRTVDTPAQNAKVDVAQP